MAPKSDIGAKFDRGKIDKILTLVSDLNDGDLGVLINDLRQEQVRRNLKNNGKKTDTIQT